MSSPQVPGFTSPYVYLRAGGGDGTYFQVLAPPPTYSSWRGTWTVPVGMVTDLASVPWPLTWLIPRYGVWTLAAVLHDYLRRIAAGTYPGVMTERDADGLLRQVMAGLGTPLPTRWLMWAAVRLDSRLSQATPVELVQFTCCAVAAPLLLAPTLPVWAWQRGFHQLGVWTDSPASREHPVETAATVLGALAAGVGIAATIRTARP